MERRSTPNRSRSRGLPRAALLGLLIWVGPTFVLGGCTTGPDPMPDAPHRANATSIIDPHHLLRQATDHEALYTLAGGLKPMSSGFWRGSFDLQDPDLAELVEVRRALGHLRNDVWYADVQVFTKAQDGSRSAHAYVVHREALSRMIERHAMFWSPWGITPDTHPSEIVAVVDRMDRGDRWRGYGYLFGYPDDAVDFFVEAGLAAEDGREVGPGKDREFVQIPTFAADSGRFTYAVPTNHVATPTDRWLAENAERILAAYTEARPRMRDARITTEGLLRLNDRFQDLVISEAPLAR